MQAGNFQKNILGGVILVYNRHSEQSVCNLTKRRTLPLLEIRTQRIFNNLIEQNQKLGSDSVLQQSVTVSRV